MGLLFFGDVEENLLNVVIFSLGILNPPYCRVATSKY
jgi:hypothetical protein